MLSIFISHSREDQHFVHDLNELFTSLGANGFVDERAIAPGETWPEALVSGLEDCEWFLVVVSSHSVNSDWVKDEVAWALESRRNRILVVSIDETKPAMVNVGLSRVQCIDFLSDPIRARNSINRLVIDSVYHPNRSSFLIEGNWHVRIDQHEGEGAVPNTLSYEGELNILARNNEYAGTLIVFAPDDFIESHHLPFDRLRFQVEGGFSRDRLLQMNYLSRYPSFVQFGAFILKLHSVPTSMTGKFVGYGAVSDGIISGDVTCSRLESE